MSPSIFVPSVDSLMARLNESRPSNWDIPLSLPNNIQRRSGTDFVRAAIDPAMAAGPVPIFEEPKPVVEERVEAIEVATLVIKKKTSLVMSSATDNG